MLLRTKKYKSYYNKNFNDKLKEIIKNENGRVMIAYIYPLFSSDDSFFSFLIDYPNWQTSQILHNIANDRFPNGIPNELGIKNLKLLLVKINSSILSSKISSIIKEEENRIPNGHISFNIIDFNFEENQEFLASYDPILLADDLNRHQRSIILSVKLADFHTWFHSKKPPQILLDLVRDHTKALTFFTDYLNNNSNHQKNLIAMFNRFIYHNNLWGASQINEIIKISCNNLEDNSHQKCLHNIYDIIFNIKSILTDINTTFFACPADFDQEQFILLGQYIKMLMNCQDFSDFSADHKASVTKSALIY